MRHQREEVIERTVSEFEQLDHLIAHISDKEWNLLVPRPETKDPWTVKDAVAHITHWKSDVVRKAMRKPLPPEERGLNINDGNHLIYMRWHNRPAQEVLAWHRQVQQEVLAALKNAPETWFSARERRSEWPYDLDGHSAYHRIRDIERVLSASHSEKAQSNP